MRCQLSSGIASTAARTVLIIRTPIEYCQPACSRRSKTFVFQNPESALRSLAPVAPAPLTRAISSSQKRSIPDPAAVAGFRLAGGIPFGAADVVDGAAGELDDVEGVKADLGVEALVGLGGGANGLLV